MANYNNILDRVQQAIPELTNTSAASIWKRIVAVFASVIDIFQLEISRSETRIEYSARNLRVMGKRYYIDTAFAYQDGDPVVVVDTETLREGYATTDTSKQIIKQASMSISEDNQIYLKVATTDSDGNLISLTTNQLLSFRSYMNHFTPAGIELVVFSSAPDTLKTSKLYIRYNSEYSLTAIQNDLIQTLQKFQTSFNPDIPLYVNDIENAIKAVSGIRDVWFDGVISEYATSSGTETSYPVNGILQLNAGYFNFDPDIYDWTKNISIFTAV